MSSIRLLINGNDAGLHSILAEHLPPLGYECRFASNGKEGLRIFIHEAPDIVLTALEMAPMDGFEFIRRAKDIRPTTPLFAISETDSEEYLMSALQQGASDVIQKPIQLRDLDTRLRNIFDASSHAQVEEESSIIGSCAQIQTLRRLIRKLSRVGRSTIVIYGESGTGKEVAAREIHRQSRFEGPFIPFNCALSDGGLIENALFGHERGAFTDAKTKEKGLLEAAHKGTLFLDEIGEMHVEAQAKLLRFLETGSFRRLGGHEELKVETRVIAATHRDLKQMVKEGRFREDLFFRLNVLPVTLPALRERGNDLFVLAEHFLSEASSELNQPSPRLSPSARSLLASYEWPGNVRELKNLMERFVLLQEGLTVDLEDLPPELAVPSDFALETTLENELKAQSQTIIDASEAPPTHLPYAQARRDFERSYFRQLLTQHTGNVAAVARASALDPSNLRRTLKRLDLDPATYRPDRS